MKILGIEHVGIAVNNFEESSSFWRDIIGLDLKVREEVDSQGVITDIYPTGNGKIELLMETYPNSPISRFLKKRGPGIHHICLEVDDINKAMVKSYRGSHNQGSGGIQNYIYTSIFSIRCPCRISSKNLIER